MIYLLFGFNGYSQHYNFRHIKKEDGLPSSDVYDAVEDENGYMWIATRNGIVRFDGKEYKQYGPSRGFKDQGVYRIFKDRKNQLWFISLNYHLYRLEHDRLILCFPNEKIGWIDEDEQGNKYAITRTAAYLLFYGNSILYKKTIPGSALYFIKKLKRNPSVIFVDETAVLYLKDRRLTRLGIEKITSLAMRVYELSDGRILLCDHKGIHVFRPDDLSIQLVYPFVHNEILCLYEDTLTKDIWIGTVNGAYKFKNGKIDKKALEIFFKASVTSIHQNKDGRIWFTFYGDGIYYGNFESRHFTTNDGLKSDQTMFIKKQGAYVYTFAVNSAISCIKNDKVQPMQFEATGAPIRQVLQGGEGKIFMKSLNQYWTIENGETRTFKMSSLCGIEKRMQGIRWIDKDQNIYYDNEGTLFRYDAKKKTSYLFPNDTVQTLLKEKYREFEFVGVNILYISADSLCYAVDKGIVMTGTNNHSFNFRYDSSYMSMPTDMIFTPAHNMVVATQNKGIDILIRGRHHFYTLNNGLPDNYISHVYYDDGYLWACTNNGLARLQLDKNDSVVNIVNFNTGNILIADEVNGIAIGGDQVYAATNDGVSVFRKNIKMSGYTPPVCIQSIQVNDRDTSVTGEMILPYNQNNISIGYRAISFSSAGISYKYMLEGLDKAFHYSKLDNIKYAALRPGKYRFVVYAKTENGNWNTTPQSILFTVLPPYWKTWWFISGCIFGALLVVVLIVYRIINVNRKRDETRRRILESELRALRLHMNPHFIFNTLNSLQSFVLLNKPLEANDYIARFSQLIRWIMSYSDRNEITLREELEFLDAYIELEQLRFERVFILIKDIDPQLDVVSTRIPPLVIQPFIENAIKYGLAGSNKKGILELTLLKRQDHILVTVQDNGVGRDQVKQEQNNSPREMKSTGIAYTEERLRLLIADQKVEQTVHITDLFENGQAAGTKVEILIPILR